MARKKTSDEETCRLRGHSRHYCIGSLIASIGDAMNDIDTTVYQLGKEITELRGVVREVSELVQGRDGRSGLVKEMADLRVGQEKLMASQVDMRQMLQDTTNLITTYTGMIQKQTDRLSIGVVFSIAISVMALFVAVIAYFRP